MSDKPNYTPGYTDEGIANAGKEVNLSGLTPQQNLSIEEAAQRRAAENPVWQIAREVNGRHNSNDSRAGLEALGFKIIEESELFYGCQPPEGWTKETSGFWTTVRDAEGNERISQFFKGAWYDTRAFISFRE